MAKGKQPSKSTKPRTAKAPPLVQQDAGLLAIQQSILDIFKEACSDHTDIDFETTLQQVKKHLYERDFTAAFSKDGHLSVYAARWSPSRALGYLQLLVDLDKYIKPALSIADAVLAHGNPLNMPQVSSADASDISDEETIPLQIQVPISPSVICLGGGAGAELVACATWLRLFVKPTARVPQLRHILCVDMADWSRILERLDQALSSSMSEGLASDHQIRMSFEQKNVLDTDLKSLHATFAGSRLITIMFTLNELYSSSLGQTQRLLLELTMSVQPGTLLLVVDSPGSYSSVTVNGSSKKYPMHWLLDHTMLSSSNKRGGPDDTKWEKLVGEESKWFRIPPDLRYPVCPLENMRYQLHLYKRLGSA